MAVEASRGAVIAVHAAGGLAAAMRRHCGFFVLLKVFAAVLWQFCRPTAARARRPKAWAKTRTRKTLARARAKILM